MSDLELNAPDGNDDHPAVQAFLNRKEKPAMTIPEQAVEAEDRHYLSAVLLRLKTLYDLTKESNVREQISDEVDWIEARLAALPPLRAREEIARTWNDARAALTVVKRTDGYAEVYPAGPNWPIVEDGAPLLVEGTWAAVDEWVDLRCADAILSRTAPEGWQLVPKDDPTRDHANTLLPIEMVFAGQEALENCQSDLNNYVSGETPDWDSGMIAVAVYRAMCAAAPGYGTAAPPPLQAREETARKTVWLVVRDGLYTEYRNAGSPNWVADPWRAAEYETFEAAEYARKQITFDEWRNRSKSIEHIFINRPKTIAPPKPIYSEAALSRTAGQEWREPEGWQLVPKEPTPEMLDAADKREDDEPLSSWGRITPAPFDEIYRAMLAAAPPVVGPKDGE